MSGDHRGERESPGGLHQTWRLLRDAFRSAGITIHLADYDGYPEYPQPHPPFAHAVSALDLLFCTGPKAIDYMKDVCPMLSIG